MDFKDKYTASGEKDKLPISTDTYALGEVLVELIGQLKRLAHGS